MAAPQQHPLTNTSCTFPASHAVFSSTAGSYGGGQPASCGDLHGRVSGASNRDIQSSVYSSAAVVSQPILGLTVSRKTRPCSLCGTAALRSRSTLVTNSPISPQEQPVVLLHRLEDGLPEGDVDSLRAFGTIRLLPVHRYNGKAEAAAGDSKHECDRKYQSVASHIMAPGNLAYKSFQRGGVKKRTELGEGNHNHGDISGSLTNETKENYSAIDEHCTLEEYLLGEKTVKSVKNVTIIVKPEVEDGGTSHRANKRTENRVYENRVESRKDRNKETHGALSKTVSPYHNLPSQYSTNSLVSSVSPESQSFNHLSSVYHQTPSLAQAESTDHSAVTKHPHLTSNNSSIPQTNTSSITNIYPHCSTSQSFFGTQDAIQHSLSPSTPMSTVCSPVVPLTSTLISSSQSQNLGSPSAISPPESPASPPPPFSPLPMGSPLACDREALHSSCSVDVQPSSPYSPCTLPSLPASPTSLPSSSDSPPSPAPSLDSPPVSPATSSGQQSEVSHNQALPPCSERLGDDPNSDISASAAQSDTVLQSEAETKEIKSRDHKVSAQYYLSPLPSMENTEELSNKSFIDQQVGTRATSASETVRAPSADIQTPKDTCTASQNSETKTQVDSCPGTSGTCEEDKEKSVEETGHLNSGFTKCLFNSESVEVEKTSSDSRNSLMKLVLKVKHPGSQQLPLGSEKKEYNKESGIPKIVLTLTGKGPNKEYSCSNRIRHESESCSGGNVNNKKHKTKKNKRQKPKDREKIKKIVKGDKHKRHLELFGEDSNDSCDNIADNFSDHPGERRHSRTQSLEEQELHSSVVLSPEESPSVHEEKDSALSENESVFDSIKSRENREKNPSTSPVDGSLSHYLPELKSDTPDIDEAFGDKAKDLPSVEESKERPESQIKSVENNIEREFFEQTDEIPETRETELPCSELKQTEQTSKTSSNMFQSSEISHQAKHSEGLILRSRRSRHAKNTESGRNSDSCLWVSFGMNAPVALPAADMPSLKPVLTSKERTRLKESSATECKTHVSSHDTSIGVGQKSVVKTGHKECREKEKAEIMSEVTSERVLEERAKLLSAEYDIKNERSHSYYKTQYSSLEGSSHAHSRTRSHDDSTHHRHRQSHKRPRKSDENREEMAKKEIEYCHQCSVDPIDKVDNENQEVRTNIHKEKLRTFNLTPVWVPATDEAQTHSEETQIAKIPTGDDSSHHRHRQLCKNLRKLEDGTEGMAKKEMESYHQDSLNPIDKNDCESQEMSTDVRREKSPTSNYTPVWVSGTNDAQNEEKIVAKTPSTLSDILLPIGGDTHVREDPSDTTPQSEENVPSSEIMESPDRPRSFNSEEFLDSQYYRPKKIRKICDTKIARDQWYEKKSLDPPEEETTQIPETVERTHNSYINSDFPYPPSSPEPVTTNNPSGVHGSVPETSRSECDTSEVEDGKCWKPQVEPVKREGQPKNPQDAEIANEQRKRKYLALTPQGSELVARVKEEPNEQSHHAATEELKEEIAEKQEDIATDTLPGIEDNEKQEISKKEKRKKSRREKRKDNSGPGSRCSALQEAQLRREVEHDEERGRRLAQEIKGFNWLEQKIKNGSLLSSHSTPTTPTSPATKEREPTSRALSTPAATPSSQSAFSNKEEGSPRKNSLSGISGGTGLKGHLQTAVPPIIPPSKVTALPKRRQSLGTPVTPPCSASSALLPSVTSIPSMTVQGALYTCEPTTYRSEHRRAGLALGKNSTSFEHEHTESDKATLYSCITSNKATLYGVKDNNFEALYHTVSASPVIYGSASSDNADARYNITTSPSMGFYTSSKHHEINLHSEKSLSANSSFNAPVISASNHSRTLKDQQQDSLHSPKPNLCSPRNSDWSTQQGSSFNSSSQSSGYSVDSQSSQCFSHKQTLLRRAFQEMLKSEPNNSPIQQAKEKQVFIHKSPAETSMNKAVGSTSGQPSSGSTQPTDTTSTNLQYQYPNSAPSPLTNKSSSETIDSYDAFSHSLKAVSTSGISVKSDRDVIEPVCDEGKKPFPATEMVETAESVTCKVDPSNSHKIMKSESDPDVRELKYSDNETLKQIVTDNKNVMDIENPKHLQSNIIDTIVSASGGIDVKVLKDELSSKSDDKIKEDTEVQPTLLLSVLYKELMKTRQEVEKLRKVQELMLTEKGEKKEDVSEQNTENKAESDKMDENANNTERTLEKEKEQESDDAELKIDDNKCLYHESKRSKISIRNDLLPQEDSMAMNTASSDTLASHKNTPFTQQTSSPTLASMHMVQPESQVSVITLESSVVPETSHLSRISPAIPAASPGLPNNISGLQKLSSSLLRGHATKSPEMSSPILSRSSPGVPKTIPALPRASPGIPISNISPGISISPGLSSSPGISKNSPGVPRSSPGVLRMSPGHPRVNSGVPRASPGASVVSPGTPVVSPGAPRTGQGLVKNSTEATIMSPGIPQMSSALTQGNIFNPPINPSSTDNLQMLQSQSAATLAQPKMTTVQSITSPLTPIPRFPQIPITSTAVPIISPTGIRTNCIVPRTSPSISKIDTVASASLSKTDSSLTDMSPTKLRSVFGISNSEVELMPVSVGAKHSLHEPQPQTFLKLVEDNHPQANETPLLMNTVKGIHQDCSSKEAESLASHGSIPFHNLACHEDPRTIKTHQYEGEIKRHAFSTSDLPDHPPSVCKQPPPLKPVSTLLRRHSDNLDIHSVMHHQAVYPGTHKNPTNSLHLSNSAAELKNANSVHPFNQTRCSPTQYPSAMSGTGRRRNSETNSSERSREYQQSIPMGMQHSYPHLTPGASMMRSLGPDKATIFPIPPTMPAGVRPFRPTTPPSVTRGQMEHFQNENFYRSNFSFFERIREKFAHTCDSGVNSMDRLQPSTASMEKPIQPQTFAPRVLVRESMPEASHIPTTIFTTLHFPNLNQPLPNVIPSHQNPYSGNMHSVSAVHHMAQGRLHPSTNQATSSTQRNSSSGSGGEKLCFRCPQPARFICSACKKAWYCSEQCQREHWSIHGAACVL